MGRQQFTFYNFNYLFHDGGQIISFYMTGTPVMKESKIIIPLTVVSSYASGYKTKPVT